ncbi:MAG: hemolysin [Candidatus Omnitrophica bacterium CG_4_10_14_0_8_um_filter_43_18]|nr:MAG: hemolysin [Candidatus Omnitrophica bacterium CG_4_10_14_0_8_um_filter_43_18]
MIYIPTLVILFILSALFSGSETALFSLSKIQIKRINTRYPAAGKTISGLLMHPRTTLTTILIGNMLVNVTASGMLSTFFIEVFHDRGIGISIGVMTFLLLVFGELTPKSFAIRNAEVFSAIIARPLFWFAKIAFPVRWILSLVTNLFYYAIVGKKTKKQPFITQSEFETLVSIGEKEGIVGKDEKHMIQTVFDMGKRDVEQIMVPRVDMVVASAKISADEFEKLIEQSKHSKIPVYGSTIDEIIGVIYAKQFVLDKKEPWLSFIKPVLFVPQTKKIDELMVEFQTSKIYIAIVVDEYGGTAGLVTMDDILEEIVGEIRDEYDKDERLFQEVEPGVFKVNGKMTLHDLKEDLGIDAESQEAETVGGFIMQLFERIPKQNDTVKYKDFTFIVDEVKKNRIQQATIKKNKGQV